MILFERWFIFCLEEEGASKALILQRLQEVTLLGDLVRLFTCLKYLIEEDFLNCAKTVVKHLRLNMLEKEYIFPLLFQ